MADLAKVRVVEPDGTEFSFWAIKGITVWEALEMIGWDARGACGGAGTCGKCKFRLEGQISSPSNDEINHLIPEEIKSGQRLACLTYIEGDFSLYIDYWPGEVLPKSKLLQYHPYDISSCRVTRRKFFIPGHHPDTPVPIYDRIKHVLTEYHLELELANINHLNKLDRPGRPAIELNAVIFDDNKVKYISRHQEPVLGLAMDIGSTSLFGALLDLSTGDTIAMASQSNMQRIYGEDIISRVNYALEHENGHYDLQRILINNLNSMIDEIIGQTKYSCSNIYHLTAVGNPVMLHLFLGLNTSGLGRAPFTGVFTEAIEVPTAGLGLQVNQMSRLKILPQLGGYVGADTTACILSLPANEKKTYLLIDIGTNGELVLHHQGKMWASSAAAGPALEGGQISCGVRASEGAIDRIFLEEGKVAVRTIGGGKPRGICGSGIIELTALLLKTDCLDHMGILTDEASRIFQTRITSHGQELILATDGTSSNALLTFSQDDIRQVQLAKSAIRTAIDIMLVKAKINESQLDCIYMAGVFGSYLDPQSAIDIGLIPAVEINKIKNIGNAAAQGAIKALVADDSFAEADHIKSVVQCIELATEPEFQNLFINNLNFP
jgi:uncharacterized 2Fe-2S/4Fe-4S cluster protein (DUF4445 family)